MAKRLQVSLLLSMLFAPSTVTGQTPKDSTRGEGTVKTLFGIALVVGCGACGLTDVDVACTAEAVPSLRIEVVDSVSATLVADPTVWVRDEAYQVTLPVFDGVALGPYERAGTYEIHVEHVNYWPWVSQDVKVTKGRCHVDTQSLTARLRPLR